MSIVKMASGGYAYSSFNFINTKTSIENVECRVCDDVFSLQGERVPRLLHCGHTVCHQCLTRLPLHETTILCPFDRQPTEVADSGVWSLKKNFALIELLEKLQYSSSKSGIQWNEDTLVKEKELAISCDENEQHIAVLYCITCSTHLCLECSVLTHSTRTLAKHKRVPLSEKPREIPKCTYHPMHLVEFVCLEKECQSAPSHALMCYICKDYGRHVKHKHVLLESEAAGVRSSIMNTMERIRSFAEEVMEWANKIGSVILQVEGGLQVVTDSDGNQRPVQVKGSAELSRQRVKQYFAELHEQITRQEKAALVVVESHIRERLCMLKQQQEDMAILLSQISSVCQQCDKTIQQDDTKVVLAKAEVMTLLETIQKQQQQFADLPEQLHLNPNVPITFTKDNRAHIGPKMEMRVVTLGLDNAGKTSILFQLKQNESITTIPTIGFNVETVEYKNLKFTIWDVGGQKKLRPLWKHYYFNTQALIFVVDSSDRTRMPEAYNALAKLLQEKELKDASLLIFANKQDKDECMTIEEMTEQFSLFKLCCNRSWHIQGCDTRSGVGLLDGLEWLCYQLVAAGL